MTDPDEQIAAIDAEIRRLTAGLDEWERRAREQYDAMIDAGTAPVREQIARLEKERDALRAR